MHVVHEEKLELYSKSKLKAQCRYAYRNDNGDTLAAMRGTAVHEAIAYFLINRKMDNDTIRNICDLAGIPDVFHGEVIDLFDQWMLFIGDSIHDTKEIVCVESNDASMFRYGKRLASAKINDTYGLCGIFDLVAVDKKTGLFEVTDWKSGQLTDEFENVVNGTLACLYYGLNQVRSTVYSVALDRYTSLHVGDDNIDMCLSMILDRIAEIKELESGTELPRKINTWCPYCSLKGKCKLYIKAISEVPYYKEDVVGFDTKISQKSKLDIIKKSCGLESDALKRICLAELATGSEVVGDYEYYLDEKTTYDYPAESIYNTLVDLGCDSAEYSGLLDKILKISKGNLDKLLKEIKRQEGTDRYKKVKELVLSQKTVKNKKPNMRKKLKR